MDTRKSSFRLLLALAGTLILLLTAACSSATPAPTAIPTATLTPIPTPTPLPTVTPIKMRAGTDIPCDEDPTLEQIVHVFEKYGPIIQKDPEWHGLGEWYFMDRNGDWDNRIYTSVRPGMGFTDPETYEDKYGIRVVISAKDQADAAGSRWIPYCIEGVPLEVIIFVGEIAD